MSHFWPLQNGGWKSWCLAYTCRLFLTQRREIFIRISCNHCAHIWKCPKTFWNLQKQSEQDPLIIFGTWSQDIICQVQPLLFQKLENLPFAHTFQSIIALGTNYTFTHYIFSTRLSDTAATTNTFQEGVRNWCTDEIECEIEVFDSQARLTPKAWELAGILV